MNYSKACNILEINNKIITINDIKKQYHIMALKYHPDKCKLTDANEKFQEINDAYTYLLSYDNIKKSCETDSETHCETDYNDILYNFLNEHFKESGLSVSIIKNIINNTFLPYILNNSNSIHLNEVYKFLKDYQDILCISDDIIDKINKYINIETLILNPTINDLVNDNIFILNHKDSKFYVPLWHHELYYECSNNEIIKIQCIPELYHNISIDNDNNIHIKINKNINELFSNKYVRIDLGDRLINFDSENLYLKKNQSVVLKEQGISSIDNNDMFNTSNKSNLIIHFNLD